MGRAQLTKAAGNTRCRTSRLLHGELGIGELVAGVRATQNVSSFGRRPDPSPKRLIGSHHVGAVATYALRLCGLNGCHLGRRKPGDLILRELLAKRRSTAYV